MALKAANFAETTLQSAVQPGDVVFVVASADLAKFPTLAPGDWFYLTVDNGTVREIVKCTAMTSNSFTVVRAQEGTTARAWPAGTRLYCAITAATLADVIAQAQSGPMTPAVGSMRYNTATGLTEYWSGSSWVPLNTNDSGLNDVYWADDSSDLPGGTGFSWPGLYRRASNNVWQFERRLNQGLPFKHLPQPTEAPSPAAWAPVATFGTASASTTVTGSNINLPSGKVLIIVATDRDASPPAPTSITHPALSNLTLRENFTTYNTGSRRGRVAIYEGDSSGGTGNMVVTFPSEAWVTYVHARHVPSDRIGAYIGSAISSPVSGVSNVTVSRTGGTPKVDLTLAHGFYSDFGAAWSVSRNSDVLQTGSFSGWLALASTSAAGAVDNVPQTFSISPGTFWAVGAVLQWAGPSGSSLTYNLSIDDLFTKLICQPGTTEVVLPVLTLPSGSDANGPTGLEYYVVFEVPPNSTLLLTRGPGAQLWTGPNSGNVASAQVTSGATSRKNIGLVVRSNNLWQVVAGAVD